MAVPEVSFLLVVAFFAALSALLFFCWEDSVPRAGLAAAAQWYHWRRCAVSVNLFEWADRLMLR